MDKLIPDYGENIIVQVVYKGIHNWYVTDKEIWYLDYKKRITAFEKRGFEIKYEYIDEARKNLLVLDVHNINAFLERIEKYKISSQKLRILLKKSKVHGDDSWKYDFRPSLYINFDERRLYSLYSEPASYEEYVPMNWVGEYLDFLSLIPQKERYWMEGEKINLLEIGDKQYEKNYINHF